MVYCKNCKWFKWEKYERHTEPVCRKPIFEEKPWGDYLTKRRDASIVNKNGDCPDFEQKIDADKTLLKKITGLFT